jgi:hypothetical protein
MSLFKKGKVPGNRAKPGHDTGEPSETRSGYRTPEPNPRASKIIGVRMAQMPQPFVSRDKAFHIPPARSIGSQRPTGQHHLQNMKKLFRDLEIRLIAGVMERDQDFIRQAPAVPGRAACSRVTARIFFSLAHRHP